MLCVAICLLHDSIGDVKGSEKGQLGHTWGILDLGYAFFAPSFAEQYPSGGCVS